MSGCSDGNILYTYEPEQEIPKPMGLEQFWPPDDPMHEVVAAQRRQSGQTAQAGMPELNPAPSSMAQTFPEGVEATVFEGDFPGDTFQVELAGLKLTFPANWEEREVSNTMRLAEYRLASEDSNDGEVVIFSFGPGQGGSAMANAERWANQFQGGEDSIIQASFQNNLRITRVMASGDYTPAQMNPSAPPAETQTDQALDGLIIEGGREGTVFIRLAGPSNLIKDQGSVMEAVAAHVRTPEAEVPSRQVTTDGLLLPGMALLVPEHWEAEEPDSSMRIAQYRVPGESSADQAEFVAFYFGEAGGGGVQANINRWIGQISQPDGSDTRESSEILSAEVGPFQMTMLRAQGTYTPTPMGPPGGGGMIQPQPNSALVGIIIEGGSAGPIYLRLVGPEQTVINEFANFQEMIGNIRPVS